MNRAQAYLAKTLPVVPPVPDEIEEPQSAGAAIADAAARFLGRHLACEPRQHTVLALWVIYAWCFKHISTAVYLAVLRAFFAGISRLSRDENSIRDGMGNRNSDFSITCADVRIEALFLYAPKKNTNRWVVYMESVSSASGKRHFLRALRPSGCAPAFGRVEVKSFVAYPALGDSATQRTRGGVARAGLL